MKTMRVKRLHQQVQIPLAHGKNKLTVRLRSNTVHVASSASKTTVLTHGGIPIGSGSGPSGVYYRNCDTARHAEAAPYMSETLATAVV